MKTYMFPNLGRKQRCPSVNTWRYLQPGLCRGTAAPGVTVLWDSLVSSMGFFLSGGSRCEEIFPGYAQLCELQTLQSVTSSHLTCSGFPKGSGGARTHAECDSTSISFSVWSFIIKAFTFY